MKKVVIIQRGISKHRLSFYENLRTNLAAKNIHLHLIQGQFGQNDSIKKDFSTIQWATVIKNRVFRLFGKELYWQPALRYSIGFDLVIVEQANRLLLNYILLMLRRFYKFKLAFWGHGRNFQSSKPNSLLEQFKRIYSIKADWWFTYNDLSTKLVTSLGYPENRITSVQNAIDTRCLVETRQSITQVQLRHVKAELGIKGNNVCIYTGGMYPEKRLNFLLEACVQIRKDVPDFEMIFIGAGSEDKKVKEAAEKYEWVHYVGPKFDEEKVPYFMLSRLFLMPALVGLSILDAFALETPLITTNNSGHGPEIDYLTDGVNGMIVRESNDPPAYAAQVTNLLKDDTAREKLIVGCRVAREKYTIEEMVERFADGIVKALDC